MQNVKASAGLCMIMTLKTTITVVGPVVDVIIHVNQIVVYQTRNMTNVGTHVIAISLQEITDKRDFIVSVTVIVKIDVARIV